MNDKKELSDEDIKKIAEAISTIHTGLTKRQPRAAHGIIYFWLFISWVLNITGIASIVDGLIIWSEFFYNFISIYRRVLRDPILALLRTLWPTAWPEIPSWVGDLFVIYSGLLIAATAMFILERGASSSIWKLFFDRKKWFSSIMATALLPLLLLLGVFSRNIYWRIWSRNYYKYLGTTLIALMLLMFINFQVSRK